MTPRLRTVLLAGGGGGARLARGFYGLVSEADTLVLTNPGDDFEHLGLLVCPDTDSVLYAVSDAIDAKRGWGRQGESWSVLDEVERLGGASWFQLGDRDIALHLLRREGLDAGQSLTRVTADLAEKFGIRELQIVPASEQPVRTVLTTAEGDLDFQSYFVGRQCEPKVESLEFQGAAEATPAPDLLAFLKTGCDVVILGPSNPYLSLAPMLAISGIVEALENAAPVMAVAPIVDGAAIKGPLAKLMADRKLEPTALSWVDEMKTLYPGLIDLWVLDSRDQEAAEVLRLRGDRVFTCDTMMTDTTQKIALASQLIEEVKRFV
ncbi:MAG: 2-phospho-L-lactate transferase CofD family protein [Luminiphilus sp.]|nr:2-phospho-L-lactate transferase CofD family protein [Luminiphilus sp.]